MATDKEVFVQDRSGNIYRQVNSGEVVGNILPSEGEDKPDAPEPDEGFEEVMLQYDNWKHRAVGMVCNTCMYYVPKSDEEGDQTNLGRCRRHAPVIAGWPAVFETDWCGDHKLSENSEMVRKVGVETI